MALPTRRDICRAVLFTFGAVLGKYDILSAQWAAKRGPGRLTVDLDQWGGIEFKHRGKSVVIPVAEVFNALVEGK